MEWPWSKKTEAALEPQAPASGEVPSVAGQPLTGIEVNNIGEKIPGETRPPKNNPVEQALASIREDGTPDPLMVPPSETKAPKSYGVQTGTSGPHPTIPRVVSRERIVPDAPVQEDSKNGDGTMRGGSSGNAHPGIPRVPLGASVAPETLSRTDAVAEDKTEADIPNRLVTADGSLARSPSQLQNGSALESEFDHLRKFRPDSSASSKLNETYFAKPQSPEVEPKTKERSTSLDKLTEAVGDIDEMIAAAEEDRKLNKPVEKVRPGDVSSLKSGKVIHGAARNSLIEAQLRDLETITDKRVVGGTRLEKKPEDITQPKQVQKMVLDTDKEVLALKEQLNRGSLSQEQYHAAVAKLKENAPLIDNPLWKPSSETTHADGTGTEKVADVENVDEPTKTKESADTRTTLETPPVFGTFEFSKEFRGKVEELLDGSDTDVDSDKAMDILESLSDAFLRGNDKKFERQRSLLEELTGGAKTEQGWELSNLLIDMMHRDLWKSAMARMERRTQATTEARTTEATAAPAAERATEGMQAETLSGGAVEQISHAIAAAEQRGFERGSESARQLTEAAIEQAEKRGAARALKAIVSGAATGVISLGGVVAAAPTLGVAIGGLAVGSAAMLSGVGALAGIAVAGTLLTVELIKKNKKVS